MLNPGAAFSSGRSRRTLATLALLALVVPPLVAAEEDDVLPPLPEEKQPPAPADWAAWGEVSRMLGYSQTQADESTEHSDPGGMVTMKRTSSRETATVRFELELDPDSAINAGASRRWRVVRARGGGTHWSSYSRSGPRYSAEGSAAGSYAGAMSLRPRPALSLNLRTGEWGFTTLGETDAPWSIHQQGRTLDNGRETESDDTVAGGTLENSWVKGTAPRRVGAAGGSLHVQDGSAERTFSRTATVQFWPDWGELELVVEIANYARWRPRGSLLDADAPGEIPLEIVATLRPKAEKPTAAQIAALPKVKRFRFELAGTSREPGVCMNWPVFGPDAAAVPKEDPEYDLRFAGVNGMATQLSPRKQKAGVRPIVDPAGLPTAWVRLDCYDFGAHADLRVFAELADGREAVGYLRDATGPNYLIHLPQRDDGTLIAKSWRDEMEVKDDDAADVESRPKADGQNGDGYSVYEEYRGFRINGAHLRLRPDRKDLLVSNRLGADAVGGIKLFAAGTADPRGGPGFAVHYQVREEEMPASREMNLNRSDQSPRTGRESQHGLVITEITTGDHSGAKYGERKPLVMDWRPKNFDTIDFMKSKDSWYLDGSMAHEISHTVGTRHHGDIDIGPVIWERVRQVIAGPLPRVRYYFRETSARYNAAAGRYDSFGAGKEVTLRREDGAVIDPTSTEAEEAFFLPISLRVATHHGQHSGMEKCWMRYAVAGAYVPPSEPEVRVLVGDLDDPGATTTETKGHALCADPRGTGINDPEYNQHRPRYGAATLGNCRAQMCVRDDAPDLFRGK